MTLADGGRCPPDISWLFFIDAIALQSRPITLSKNGTIVFALPEITGKLL